jgi:hypothetical protein
MNIDRSRPWLSTLSRRKALAAAGSLAAGLATTSGNSAQEATPAVPETTETGERIFTMFVQTAQAGGFQPKPGEEGVFQVVLYGVSAQTIYFSDRPHRIVGSVSTADFLAGLGFSADNPPNAAIVTQTEEGDEDVIIVELIDPVYDSFAQTLTYDVIVLEGYTGDGFGELAQRHDDGELPGTFGHTSLFIDDCPDVTQCWDQFQGVIGPYPNAPVPMCWEKDNKGTDHIFDVVCSPCEELMSRNDLGRACHLAYPDKCHWSDFGRFWTCTGV